MPGQYRLQIITRPDGWIGAFSKPTLWSDEAFSLVDRDLQISPILREGFRFSGTVEFDGNPPTAKEIEH